MYKLVQFISIYLYYEMYVHRIESQSLEHIPD